MDDDQLENSLSSINDAVFDLNQSITRIEQYLELLMSDRIKTKTGEIFNSDQEIKVYELSDGVKTTRQLEEVVHVSRTTISTLWKKWFNQGIMFDPIGNKPYKSKYTLLELALGRHQDK